MLAYQNSVYPRGWNVDLDFEVAVDVRVLMYIVGVIKHESIPCFTSPQIGIARKCDTFD